MLFSRIFERKDEFEIGLNLLKTKGLILLFSKGDKPLDFLILVGKEMEDKERLMKRISFFRNLVGKLRQWVISSYMTGKQVTQGGRSSL